ncbi:ribosome maturation factor RimM [Nitrosomonas sp.]|uniref:ribosome maturation factor RimM n=1 Tax=Nitrosomonas sp. TaxID=42353 RepID=UPI0020888279|nr:ribosome maturation factor RimM [Nitrosomonas sp.]GJL75106.1 MAG: ribosome maturation factor RimM [Nitrosomonas sp.]
MTAMVIMGHVANAFGIHGWIRIYPYTENTDGLLDYTSWWLGKDNNHWHEMQLITGRTNGNQLDVKLKGCENREQALQLKGMQIAVPRNALPGLPENGEEGYYWSDLIGTEVMNLNNEKLGTIVGLFETGANDVLRVQNGKSDTQELLIPFIEQTFIKKVDLKCGRIIVDWSPDY